VSVGSYLHRGVRIATHRRFVRQAKGIAGTMTSLFVALWSVKRGIHAEWFGIPGHCYLVFILEPTRWCARRFGALVSLPSRRVRNLFGEECKRMRRFLQKERRDSKFPATQKGSLHRSSGFPLRTIRKRRSKIEFIREAVLEHIVKCISGTPRTRLREMLRDCESRETAYVS